AEAVELGLGDGGQGDDLARREASHAIARAQNAQGRIMPARVKDGATQGLVDHGGGAAALGDDDRWHGSSMTYVQGRSSCHVGSLIFCLFEKGQALRSAACSTYR